ncbi:MAG TPA: hypothetical protein VFX79_02765 [Candidatus Saccharimonadales bacterium]|nr:hypothetical protein [Candidatus Saccharimonadales bacterium]
MNKRLIIGLVALAVALALSLSSQGAKANEPYTVTAEDVSVSGLNYKGTILEDVKMYNGVKYKKCQWVQGGYNSGRSVDGSLKWFHDPANAKICRSANSPTGWIKVKGGQTGRNCGNPYKPHGNPPGEVVNGPVVMVRNFNNMNMTATARASVNLKEEIVCPDGSKLTAQAAGLAVAKIKITRQMLVSAQGNTNNLEIQLKDSAKAKAIAQAKGKIEATCGSTQIEEPEPEPEEPEEEPEKPAFMPATVIYKQPKPPKPEQPAPVVVETKPAELPNTGPGAVVATFIGVSSLASFAYSAITRRLGL